LNKSKKDQQNIQKQQQIIQYRIIYKII